MRCVILVLAAAAISSSVQAAPLATTERLEFIAAGMKNCMARSNGMSHFCECYMSTMADKVDREEIIALGLAPENVQQNRIATAFADRAKAATEECVNPKKPWWKVW